MRRLFLLLTIATAFSPIALGQKKYDMIVEKTDGTSTVVKTEDVARTYFRERGGEGQPGLSCPDEHHPHMVDLGLPSGTKWACCNLGAESPEHYGNHYAWGGTGAEGEEDICGKYYINGTSHDVAHELWGGLWCLPSPGQMEELPTHCAHEVTTLHDIAGMLFTGTNGNSIFVPFAGVTGYDGKEGQGEYGYYWSGVADSYPLPCWPLAYSLYVGENGDAYVDTETADYAVAVRPVNQIDYQPMVLSKHDVTLFIGHTTKVRILKGYGPYTATCSDSGISEVTAEDNEITILGKAFGKTTVTVADVTSGKTEEITVSVNTLPSSYTHCPDENHPHLIDLGLPSGKKWACCNVGTDKPEGHGGYYAWGETNEKSDYTAETYSNGSQDEDGNWTGLDYFTAPSHDVAHAKWGGPWKMPSLMDLQELLRTCKYEATVENGSAGMVFTGPNGGSLFLPFSGFRHSTDLMEKGSAGYYWSGESHTDDMIPQSNILGVYALRLSSGGEATDTVYAPYLGMPVRPVVDNPDLYTYILNDRRISLSIDECFTIYIQQPPSSYTINNSDTNIADVAISNSAITITGKSCGTATVTITDEVGGTTSKIIVTVAYRPLVLEERSALIQVGETYTIYIVSGNGSYSATNPAPDIVDVAIDDDEITLTGKSAGTATIDITDDLNGSALDITVEVE